MSGDYCCQDWSAELRPAINRQNSSSVTYYSLLTTGCSSLLAPRYWGLKAGCLVDYWMLSIGYCFQAVLQLHVSLVGTRLWRRSLTFHSLSAHYCSKGEWVDGELCGSGERVLTIHYSLLTVHYSLFTTHYSGCRGRVRGACYGSLVEYSSDCNRHAGE